MEIEVKEDLVGTLLDLMRMVSIQESDLECAGIKTDLGYIGDTIWTSIKLVVGMPHLEQTRVFLSDKWLSYATGYILGQISKEEAVQQITKWNRDFKK